MPEVWTMGEMLVEIMRDQEDIPLDKAGVFRGPFPSGAPAIFIDTVARMGCSAGIIGGVGRDDFGKNILDRLIQDGVNVTKVVCSDRNSTGVAFVTYFSDGSRKFIFHMGNTPAVEAKAPDATVFAGTKYFHIMGCSLMAQKEFAGEIVRAMKLAVSQGAKISFDPNIRQELLKDDSAAELIAEVIKYTNILLPGVEELLGITGKETVQEAISACFENPVLEVLALKNGSRGSEIHTRKESFKMGVYPVEQKDATGAGDCFDGAFISGLAAGKSLKEAAEMAAAAGALNAAAFGPMEGEISLATVTAVIEENKEEKQ